ncbi:MAG TPA: hypothetical protein VFW71_02090 [Actinomycetota bacterium]|nr:hypothetical protein [Actinomycetota bacterium]
MSHRPIIDAGPGLNFFSLNKERLLISVLGPLSTPETVYGEIERKAQTEQRFRNAAAVLRRLGAAYLELLPDDPNDALNVAVSRISGTPMAERLRQRQDLGELMVVAHAAVAAEAGSDAVVLIDETNGAQLADSERRRLVRLRSQGHQEGSISLVNTPTILEAAASTTYIPDRAAMRGLYERLRGLDDGLVPIERTQLLSPRLWR